MPRKRLLISWWDRQISIWAIPSRRLHTAHKQESLEPNSIEGQRLVAKIILTGDESITSVSLTSQGSLLAVSTIVSTKVFHILPRKNGTLKVQKLATPSSITHSGAKIIRFSYDSKWLCLVPPSDSIRLYRLRPQDLESGQISALFLNKVIKLDRFRRPETRLKPDHGTLGNYHRSINRLDFSADSNILVVSDLSGYLDTWVLEGNEDLLQASISLDAKSQKSSSSSDSDSSSDSSFESDEESPPNIIYGQHWIRNPCGSLLPKLPGPPLVLSFRPSASTSDPSITLPPADTFTPPATRHTPHPHSHSPSERRRPAPGYHRWQPRSRIPHPHRPVERLVAP